MLVCDACKEHKKIAHWFLCKSEMFERGAVLTLDLCKYCAKKILIDVMNKYSYEKGRN